MGKEKEKEKDLEEERKEKVIMGCKISTWFRLFNAAIGACMILYSVFSFFQLGGDSVVLVYSFKVYEV